MGPVLEESALDSSFSPTAEAEAEAAFLSALGRFLDFFFELGNVRSGLVEEVFVGDLWVEGGVILIPLDLKEDCFSFGIKCHLGLTPMEAGVTSERS